MNKNILFFDGVCHLCNGYIDFLARFKSKRLFYAPLQGATAARLLPADSLKNLNSIFYYKNQNVLQKSTAVFESLYDASPLFFWIKIFYIIPGFIRDQIYDYIAKNRYRFFGKRETCRLPTAEEKEFILE